MSGGDDSRTSSNGGERVRESVRAIRASRLLPGRFGASGYVYELEHDRLRPVTP